MTPKFMVYLPCIGPLQTLSTVFSIIRSLSFVENVHPVKVPKRYLLLVELTFATYKNFQFCEC